MEQTALRLLIQSKLADGRLPQNSIPRKAQFVVEGHEKRCAPGRT